MDKLVAHPWRKSYDIYNLSWGEGDVAGPAGAGAGGPSLCGDQPGVWRYSPVRLKCVVRIGGVGAYRYMPGGRGRTILCRRALGVFVANAGRMAIRPYTLHCVPYVNRVGLYDVICPYGLG